jgi:hypothetical protein
MLYGGGGKNSDSGGGSSSNQFKTSVIDTIVAEVQNVPGEDRCVLLLGYTDQMIEMFQVQPPSSIYVHFQLTSIKERQPWFI